MSLVNRMTIVAAAVMLAGCQQASQAPVDPTPAPAVAVPAAPTEVPAPTSEAPRVASLRKLEASEVLEPLAPSAFCTLDFLDGQPFIGQDLRAGSDIAKISGWVGDEVTRGLPADPMLRFEAAEDKTQVWEFPVTLGLKREDVATAMSAPGVLDSGFSQDFPLSSLPAGRYHLFISYVSSAQQYGCDVGRYIITGT